MDSQAEELSLPTSDTSHVQPKAPNPSADPGVVPRIEQLSLTDASAPPPDVDFDVVTLEPLEALKMLSRSIQALADLTGDIPPTPPVSRPTTPSLAEMREESLKNLKTISRPGTPPSRIPGDNIKAAQFGRGVIGSPEAHLSEPTMIDEADRATRLQIEAISRKFFSKKPPPVSIDDYLLRMHRYCPMSTAVYLAAAVYIHKLALVEKSVPVTARTVHRLLLGCLRVAMKALEDLSYPHQRFAGVGGVSEKELAKLEVAVCYLTEFDLKVDNKILHERMTALQQVASVGNRQQAFRMKMPASALDKKQRRTTVV